MRARFQSTIGASGEARAAAVKGMLTRAVATGDAACIEDFLDAIPDGEDAELGQYVHGLLAHASLSVCRAATTALAGLWGQRARPILVPLLAGGSTDQVRLGALGGLLRLKGIDAEIVARIDRIVSGLAPAGEELRIAAVKSLAATVPAARMAALVILARVLKPSPKSFVGMLKGALGSQESAVVLVAAARTILTLGGPTEQRFVEERMNHSTGALRQELAQLLGK
jgi:hypothetical protein